MPGTPLLKRLLDAGMQFSEMSQSTAEKVVHDFVKTGAVRRKDAEKTVQMLVDRGRSSTEHLVATVQAEIANQLGRFASRIDDVESRLEEIAAKLGIASSPRPVAAPVKTAPPVKAPAAKKAAPVKKAPAAKKVAPVTKAAAQ